MAFTEFDATAAYRPDDEPLLTVKPGGDGYLNSQALTQYFSDATHVRRHIDTDRDRLGLEPEVDASVDDPAVTALQRRTGGGNLSLSQTLLQTFGYDGLEESHRVRVTYDDAAGFPVVDMSSLTDPVDEAPTDNPEDSGLPGVVDVVGDDAPIYKVDEDADTWHAARTCGYLRSDPITYTGDDAMPDGRACQACADDHREHTNQNQYEQDLTTDAAADATESDVPDDGVAEADAVALMNGLCIGREDLVDALAGATAIRDVSADLGVTDREALRELVAALGLLEDLAATGALDRAAAEAAVGEVDDAA